MRISARSNFRFSHQVNTNQSPFLNQSVNPEIGVGVIIFRHTSHMFQHACVGEKWMFSVRYAQIIDSLYSLFLKNYILVVSCFPLDRAGLTLLEGKVHLSAWELNLNYWVSLFFHFLKCRCSLSCCCLRGRGGQDIGALLIYC